MFMLRQFLQRSSSMEPSVYETDEGWWLLLCIAPHFLSLQTWMTQNPQRDRAAEARSREHPHLTQHLAQKVPDKRLRKDTEPSALEA